MERKYILKLSFLRRSEASLQ